MRFLVFLTLMILSTFAHADFTPAPQSQPYLYKYASTGTVNNVIKTGAGILHSITVEGGTTSPINIYDGPTLTTAQIAGFSTTNTSQTYTLDVGFSSGCTVSTNGSLQYTVSYL